MVARVVIGPEKLRQIKHNYVNTDMPIDQVCAEAEISRTILYRYVKEENWPLRRYSSRANATQGKPAAPAPESLLAAASRAVKEELAKSEGGEADAAAAVTPEERAALGARVFRAAQAQMTTIESVLKSFQPAEGEPPSERTVRIIAALNKSLREISAMLGRDQTPPHETDNDPVPRDIDEFRRELARRIRHFIEARRARAAGLPDDSANPLA
jgi:hypothetical protein